MNKILTSAARMSDANYPGNLRQLGSDCRVVVNPAGTRYACQQRVQAGSRAVWVGKSFSTLSGLLSASDDALPGLGDACAGLPDDPAQAAPALTASRGELLELFAASDWRRDDYGRVIRRDANIRLAVSPCGAVYRVQWIYPGQYKAGLPCNDWLTQAKGPSASWLIEWSCERIYCESDETRDREALALRVANLFVDVPERACDGTWPWLPERPSSVRR